MQKELEKKLIKMLEEYDLQNTQLHKELSDFISYTYNKAVVTAVNDFAEELINKHLETGRKTMRGIVKDYLGQLTNLK